MVGLAQHRHRIALGLAVKLREHRADALQPLHQPRRRHGRSAIEQQLQRRQIGLVQRRMVEQHIDHRRHQQGEIDPLALDGLQHPFRIEALHQRHRAAAHQRRHHLGAGHVADGRDSQVMGRIWQFEIGEDGRADGGGAAVIAPDALGLASGAAGIADDAGVVRPRQIARRGGAGRRRGGHQVNAVIRLADGQHMPHPAGLLRQIGAPRRVGFGIHHQHLDLGVGQLVQMIFKRTEGMQRRGAQGGRLRRLGEAPSLPAVGGERRDAGAARQPQPGQHRLHPSQHVDDVGVGDGARIGDKGGPVGIPRQRAQGLGADGGLRVQVAHAFLPGRDCFIVDDVGAFFARQRAWGNVNFAHAPGLPSGAEATTLPDEEEAS